MNAAKINVNPLLAWREIDGQVIVISPEDSMLHELNEAASFTWRQIGAGQDEGEIARSLESEYGLEAAIARDDTRAILEEFEAKGLLRRRRMQAHA